MPAQDPAFASWFDRKVMGHKADRPGLVKSVARLDELLIGSRVWIGKANWPVVHAKLKGRITLIAKYHERLANCNDK